MGDDVPKEILILGEFHPYHPFVRFSTYEDSILKICDMETKIIQEYNPNAIFLETYEIECVASGRYTDKLIKEFIENIPKRDDIKKLANTINAKFVVFESPKKDREYEDCLVEQLLDIASLNPKTAAIIGVYHMEKAENALKEGGIGVKPINLIEKLNLPYPVHLAKKSIIASNLQAILLV